MAYRTLKFLPAGAIAGGALPWVIGVMVYLSSLAAGFGFAINASVGDWTATLSRQVSVQIVHEDNEEREARADAVVELLARTPGIAGVTRLSDRETAALLEPWLGAGNVTDDLPIPILLDVTLEPGRALDMAALGAAVRAVAPEVSIDDHEGWLVELERLADGLAATSALVVGLILAATAAIAAFGTRAGMASHRDSIGLLHHMGAEDDLIAGEFRYRFMLQGLRGGFGGLLVGVATLLAIDHFAGSLGDGLLPAIRLAPLEWLWVASLPLFAAFLTMVAAHVTVRRELARLP